MGTGTFPGVVGNWGNWAPPTTAAPSKVCPPYACVRSPAGLLSLRIAHTTAVPMQLRRSLDLGKHRVCTSRLYGKGIPSALASPFTAAYAG